MEMTEFFQYIKTPATIIHVFAVIMGMGGALISDILFNFYIKDKKINPVENKTLQVISRVIWMSLGLIVVSGLVIFLSDPIKYINSTKFLVKMLIVGIIIINGYLFWKITHKALKKIDFTDTNMHHKYVRIRRLSFVFGAISAVSWISAFILGSVGIMPFSLTEAISIYGSLVLIAIIGSQIFEYIITHKN